ncbi:MAG: translation elongation factor 4 [Nitrospirota bacterium]
MSQENIRNFCIIAHIDHGKSTLADRFLEITGTVSKRDMKHGQMLDTMDLEQERGITIKLQPVRMDWEYEGEKYVLNLIDTPGHVDFSYEVSRSLAACEGAILVVDAAQGIEAQTLANCCMAVEHNLEIIPVLNKIDLPAADVEKRAQELVDALGVKKEDIIAVSAKDGTNVEEVLKAVVAKVPKPSEVARDEDELKALIFDSVYDSYKGVVAYVRLFGGSIKRGDSVCLLNTKKKIEALEVGYFKPQYVPSKVLHSGEVGYIVTGLKSVREARVGDTVWRAGDGEVKMDDAKPLPGYNVVRPFVFASIFCTVNDEYPLLRDALEKLQMNDSALSFEPEQSGALGHGFRCGFLGLLHMEIVQERLEREYDLDLVVTAPSVSYKVAMKDGEEITISSPAHLPDLTYVEHLKEPWVKVEILVPKDYVGAIMTLCSEKRGVSKDMQYLDEKKVLLSFEMPLASIVVDFYDKLKSVSSGYASMNYEHLNFRQGNLVKLDILVADDRVDALSLIVHRDEAFYVGRDLTKRLKEIIPRANFVIPIQAAIGGKIIARETLPAFRKDVTAKLYGGDVTRKNKLLKKQKAGKKRMKMVGKVQLPQEAFLAVLKRDSK